MHARNDGEQTPAVVKTLVNLMPRAASASMFGVCAKGSPKEPNFGDKSSIVIKKTLGRSSGFAD